MIRIVFVAVSFLFVALDVEDAAAATDVCEYSDRDYSESVIVDVGGFLIICDTGGIWRPFANHFCFFEDGKYSPGVAIAAPASEEAPAVLECGPNGTWQAPS